MIRKSEELPGKIQYVFRGKKTSVFRFEAKKLG